jgi:hypothetical protein
MVNDALPSLILSNVINFTDAAADEQTKRLRISFAHPLWGGNMDSTDHPIILKELGEYVRNECVVYFTWFTFFLTMLFAVMGWALQVSFDQSGHVHRFPLVLLLMVALFAAQLWLAIQATSKVAKDMLMLDQRITAAVAVLLPSQRQEAADPSGPFVPRAYHFGVTLAGKALRYNLWFWPIVWLIVAVMWYVDSSAHSGSVRLLDSWFY